MKRWKAELLEISEEVLEYPLFGSPELLKSIQLAVNETLKSQYTAWISP